MKRVSGAPNASAQKMGARGAAFSREQGRLTARNLRDLGINVDLAPVLDVARPGGVIAATERGFGAGVQRVAATAVPFAQALQQGGVAATGKHFPGFGAATENTDFAVQRIHLSKARLRAVDEAPYRAYIGAGGKLVMLSTAIYPALSPLPAAFSPQIATGELRDRLGFEGVSITDALETVAVRSYGGPRQGRPRRGPRRHRPAAVPRPLRRPGGGPGAARQASRRQARPRRVRGFGAAGARPARVTARVHLPLDPWAQPQSRGP